MASHPSVAKFAVSLQRLPLQTVKCALVPSASCACMLHVAAAAAAAPRMHAQAPDDIAFLEEIPHNATGKVSKLTLRQMFANYVPRGRRPASKL